VGDRDDGLLEILVTHARGAPQRTGTGHVAAVGGGFRTVFGHGLRGGMTQRVKAGILRALRRYGCNDFTGNQSRDTLSSFALDKPRNAGLVCRNVASPHSCDECPRRQRGGHSRTRAYYLADRCGTIGRVSRKRQIAEPRTARAGFFIALHPPPSNTPFRREP